MNNQLTNLLFVLQLEEYDLQRFLFWINGHDISQIKQDKKHLVWTFKAKVIYTLAILFSRLGIRSLNSLIMATKTVYLPESVLKTLIIVLAKVKLLLHRNLIVIGITGSYGKTSVKEILYTILSTQYKVLKTPESYNTTLAIARVILSQLSTTHQIFIVEMGAYQIGDINKLCSFVRPKIGILTAIGKQHLERFGNQENITRAKSELLFSLPKDGLAVTNGDNAFCLKVTQTLKTKTILFSINEVKPKAKSQKPIAIRALNIKTSSSGSSFKIQNGREVISFQTQLLGTHNISNILAAIGVASYLNISWDKIKTSVSTLSPILHRLQLINGANETIVIDDAYNANPDSVRAALSVLKEFDSPRKIVITPGLVELGKEQNKENEIMGKEISNAADYLIIVGNTNKEALRKGFLSAKPKHYDTAQYQSKVIECPDLSKATKKLQEIIVPQSVILFENDLPDQYL